MNVVIFGTGYVGLTTGVVLAYLDHQVICLDVDPEKIGKLNQGVMPIYEPFLAELLALSKTNLTFTTSVENAHLEDADVIFISVGTPSLPDGSPDLQYVRSAAETIGARIGKKFSVVVNKSTVPIGSGNWVQALIRDANPKHDNFAIVSNPEFLRQGSALFDTLYPDRVVVGAESQQAIDIITNLYRPILNQDFPAPDFLPRPDGFGVAPLLTCNLASAELIKYAANAFLALKISYMNEIAMLATRVGADITQIARGIGLDNRIGPRFLHAGIGWGGSCFGKDTSALISTAQEYGLKMPIIEASRFMNYQMRTWVVDQLQAELKILKGRTIGLLGLAFKPNTDDLRDAPSLDIARQLINRGASVLAHDPIALENARKQYPDLGVKYMDEALSVVQDADAVVLVTEWPEYRKLPWNQMGVTKNG